MTYKLMPESFEELKKEYSDKKAAAKAARAQLEEMRAAFSKQGDLTRSLDVSNIKKAIVDRLLKQEGLGP